jgi:hypothetical protein
MMTALFVTISHFFLCTKTVEKGGKRTEKKTIFKKWCKTAVNRTREKPREKGQKFLSFSSQQKWKVESKESAASAFYVIISNLRGCC